MKKMKHKNNYNLLEVIIIMIITAICSILITIKATYVANGTGRQITSRAELAELIDTYNTLIDEYYTEVDKSKLIDSAIEGMLKYFGDPYTMYMTEQETQQFNEQLEGEYVGMGAEISKVNDAIIISKIFDKSPAEKAGAKVNDKIKKVDGEDVTKLTLDQIASKIKGIEGTKVKVTVERNKKEIVLNITRGKVDIQSVTSEIIVKDGIKVGYITISTFASNTYQQFKKSEEELEDKGAERLIIDLRGNTGGYLTTVHSISELFLEKDQVMYQLQVKNKTTEIKATTDKSISLKTAVLVNGGSASASEILTAALKENCNSPVIGTTTFGKGKVQKAQTLSSGAMIKYTIENWLTPTGKQIDGVGIEPTEVIKLSEEYLKNPSNKTDNQLQKALEIIIK